MDQADDFAELISLEMGKTLAEAKGEVTYGAEFFRWFAEEAVRIHGRWMQAPAGGSRLLTIRKPVGPCLFITPWNFPLAMGTRKIGPAVAAGCTMVVKPAELTPLTMLALAHVLAEAGLPDGVLNIVTTHNSKALSATLMADERLRKVSFTGSTPVGQGAGAAVGRPAAAGLDGARRQRAVHRLRGRRRRGRRRRRDDRQDAQHGRGLHRRQPVPRPRVGRRASSPSCSASGWARCAPAAARTPAPTSGR